MPRPLSPDRFLHTLSVMLAVFAALLLSACAPDPVRVGGGPVLLGESTLATDTPDPRASPTASPTVPVLAPSPTALSADELLSPLEVVTIEADFVIVTPTLPPSKTPTTTPTSTTTPTLSPTPTLTVTATATAPVFPTSVIIPVTAVSVIPIDDICDTAWEFIQPPPSGCPFFPATVGPAVFQEFERGVMIWDGSSTPGVIYALFSDGGTPYHIRFTDTFAEGQGMFPNAPWKDPAIDSQAPPGLYQPVRGFGRLWRNEDNDPVKASVRPRIGWGTMEFEAIYSLYSQMRQDGTVFLTLYGNGGFFRSYQLNPGGPWLRYAG